MNILEKLDDFINFGISSVTILNLNDYKIYLFKSNPLRFYQLKTFNSSGGKKQV